MPVLNHDIHESTRKSGAEPYGCTDREISEKYVAPERIYFDAGLYIDVTEYVQHKMSTECRYDRSLSDPGCATCKHRGSGEKYAEQIRKEGR